MIGFLRGDVLEVSESSIVVGTGESSWCTGYSVHVIDPTRYQVGKKTQLYIHTHVREDALDLFGFESSDLKKLFLTLTEVNRVGPKSALSLLTKISSDDLIQYISSGQTEKLGKIQGIGKKTAERLVVELQDKINKRFGATAAVSRPSVTGAPNAMLEALLDAKEALLGLGYRETQVASVLSSLQASQATKEKSWTTEQVIKAALKELSV